MMPSNLATNNKHDDSLYDDDFTFGLPTKSLKKKVQSMVSSSQLFTIRRLFNLRMKQQKAEFITSWVLIILLAIILIQGGSPNEKNAADSIQMAIYNLAILHIKVSSVYTRAFAFAVDFANTRDKFGAVKGNLMGLPSWLLYHHFGVYLSSISTSYFVIPRDYFEALVILVSLQSTNNTWTKKYSYVLYWGNVLLGVITSWYFVSLHVEDAFGASLCMMASLLGAYLGAGLLAMQSFQCPRTVKKAA
jgi:hypothetical protein